MTLCYVVVCTILGESFPFVACPSFELAEVCLQKFKQPDTMRELQKRLGQLEPPRLKNLSDAIRWSRQSMEIDFSISECVWAGDLPDAEKFVELAARRAIDLGGALGEVKHD